MASQADRRLSTWAEIADYIGRDVRTARRYEAERGLPVRRLPGSRSTVFALARDLDAWRAGELQQPEAPAREPPPPAPPTAPAVARRSGGRVWLLGGGAAALVAAAAALALRPPAARPETAVIVAALQNDTGESVFDRLVPRVLQVDLVQSPRLQVVGDARVSQTLALMERPRDAVLTAALAREVCARDNGGVVVAPGAARLGARYLLTATATDCVSGRVLSDGRETAATQGDVPQALDRLAAGVRRTLGESRASVSRLSVPLLPARTASFDALRAYSEAEWLSGRGHDVEAVPLYRRAIDLDGRFGLAWLGLAQTLNHARQWREDAEAMTHAYALRSTMSERDGLFTAYRFHDVVEKDEVAALDSLRALALLYPHDAPILSSLSFLQFNLGEYDDAVFSAEQGERADPRSPAPRTHLMRALIRSGRFSEARRVGDAAIRAGLGDGRLNEMRILAASEGGDPKEARRLLDAAVGTPFERDALLQYASCVFGGGHGREFATLVDRADALGRRQGVRMDWAAVAAAAADVGELDLARRYLALVEPDLRTGRFHRAQALVGDPVQAKADLARDEARWPKDTLRNAEFGPEARALIALRRGDVAAAVRAVSASDPYEWRTLELPYIRAQTLLASGDGPAAATVFRAVLAHPGWSNWPQHPLSHLGLARALRLQHDRAGARREYDAFLHAWREADPDLPQPRAAREERSAVEAALRSGSNGSEAVPSTRGGARGPLASRGRVERARSSSSP